MQMPVIDSCTVESCAYNRQRECHALAITVGGADGARCETFFDTDRKGGDPENLGHVGACRMVDCVHNVSLECQAPGIVVGYQQDHVVDCLTYQR
ncbi:MAG TPA: DUF1540 domain-containing protein [Actinopolymorphaceae bacterium]|jgi:hypothetical protein